jgi:hypothetical protein
MDHPHEPQADDADFDHLLTSYLGLNHDGSTSTTVSVEQRLPLNRR